MSFTVSVTGACEGKSAENGQRVFAERWSAREAFEDTLRSASVLFLGREEMCGCYVDPELNNTLIECEPCTIDLGAAKVIEDAGTVFRYGPLTVQLSGKLSVDEDRYGECAEPGCCA